MDVSRPTLSLIGDRYLDTQFSPDEIALVEKELRDRGVFGLKRWLLEYIAAGGLWWNIIWWEWVDLDGRDIRIGWLYNMTIGGFIFAFAAWCFGVFAASTGIAALHLVTLYFGISLRSGSVAGSQEG